MVLLGVLHDEKDVLVVSRVGSCSDILMLRLVIHRLRGVFLREIVRVCFRLIGFNCEMNFLTFEKFDVSLKSSIQSVQYSFFYLDCIDDLVLTNASSNLDHGCAMLMPFRSWGNSRLI